MRLHIRILYSCSDNGLHVRMPASQLASLHCCVTPPIFRTTFVTDLGVLAEWRRSRPVSLHGSPAWRARSCVRRLASRRVGWRARLSTRRRTGSRTYPDLPTTPHHLSVLPTLWRPCNGGRSSSTKRSWSCAGRWAGVRMLRVRDPHPPRPRRALVAAGWMRRLLMRRRQPRRWRRRR